MESSREPCRRRGRRSPSETMGAAEAGPAEIRFWTADPGPIPFALYAVPSDGRDEFDEERWEAFVGLAEVPVPPFLTGTSDEDGVARVSALPAGVYQIAVQDGHFVRGDGAIEHDPGGEYVIRLGEGRAPVRAGDRSCGRPDRRRASLRRTQ